MWSTEIGFVQIMLAFLLKVCFSNLSEVIFSMRIFVKNSKYL